MSKASKASRTSKRRKGRANISYGRRAKAPDLAKASAVWKLFHKKPKPRELIAVTPHWPTEWEYAGVAVTTYYRSDKWEDDGKYTKYYHDHGAGQIGIWHPKGMFSWATKSPKPPKVAYPDSVAVLGYSLGVDVKRVDLDGKMKKAKPERGSYLVASPDRKHLWIVEPTQGVTAMIAGPGLSVEPQGIVG